MESMSKIGVAPFYRQIASCAWKLILNSVNYATIIKYATR
ncbi:hypothetical protein VCR1J2_200095 [Vibrio coralliirubri]|nr:hypothetical protein VCR1J2_200095 [Vibrio coralliirubri]